MSAPFGAIGDTAFLLDDTFSASLSPQIWDYNHFSQVNNPSFYGRTQMRQNLPSVANGVLQLTLDTYIPPPGIAGAFYGSEIISKQSFSPTSGGGIAFQATARLTTSVAGMVGGIFGYNTGTLHDELDDELLTNEVASQRSRLQTNVYANEPLGAGHTLFTPVQDLTAFHTYRMEWLPDRVRWLVDGILVREDLVHVPQHAMALHLNFWAPGAEWAEAYSSALTPALTANANTSYVFEVTEASVSRLSTFIGGAGADSLVGTSANDWMQGGAGNDTIDGGAGVDAAVYAGTSAAAVIRHNTNGAWTVTTASDGTDTLRNVEVLHFSDQDVNLTAGATVPRDFNGDGKSDVLWRNANGDVALWNSNSGSSALTFADFGQVASIWAIQGTGDFDGDGRADILWRRSDGYVALWSATGSQFAYGGLGQAGLNWQVQGIGDFNGDGKADILWRESGGQMALWQSGGGSAMTYVPVGSAGLNWGVQGVGDFNGDGKADVLWRDNTGYVALWVSSPSLQFTYLGLGPVGQNWTIQAIGDFNGDGKADILWRDSSGYAALWDSSPSSQFTYVGLGPVGLNWHVQGTGDFNGDGQADVLWRNDAGLAAAWMSTPSHTLAYQELGVANSGWFVA